MMLYSPAIHENLQQNKSSVCYYISNATVSSLNTLTSQNYNILSECEPIIQPINKTRFSQEIKILHYLPWNLVEILKSYLKRSVTAKSYQINPLPS